ncbi:MAG: 50S ribosomal protein L37ae [Candidatus Woesearchaeota archaeon]|jgi:large subunit ribosomal protein L37Ae|nr:50S ribosomal protein L37ae [Candidatus Woesearchaeota archaeon]MDP7181623.1 50S ribosomal protein L37ae [Candidatus Woesearchaeota archaeon]MDP7198909.1 50S ribosomal protein L37ae [Candidatus Woesearchaeota archaeon]MDP7467288.1 50S ribosomal protein L37ae [Candidatus Woesearchaeota archaeon]MDP7647904.1 50S ribosomal protein L37ae [Candidatus Woesearchaeota archaeon]
MAKKQGLGAVKRFGVRYGRTTRFKRAQIENEQKKPQKCPYCLKLKAKRQAIGIFDCKGCGSTFTDEAYSVGKVRMVTEVAE